MHGSPLVRLAFVAALLALAGIPVWSLTQRRAPAAPQAPSFTSEAQEPIQLEITTTHPANVTIRYAGNPVARVFVEDSLTEDAFPLPIGLGAQDFVAEVQWKDSSASHALRVRFSRDGGTLAETTLWGGAEATGVITLPAAP